CAQRSPRRAKTALKSELVKTRRSPLSDQEASARGTRSRLGQVGRALGELHAEVRLDEAIDLAIEHGARVADFVVGPQVLHDLVGLKHVRADLVAEADLSLFVVLLGVLGLAFLFLHADKLGLEECKGVGVVLMLRALAAGLRGDAAGEM